MRWDVDGNRLPGAIRDRQVAAPLKAGRLSVTIHKMPAPIRDRQVAAPLKDRDDMAGRRVGVIYP